MKNVLTHKKILKEAEYFSITESNHHDPGLYGVNDGKTIGTYFEHKFQKRLKGKFEFQKGNAAMGIDFPELGVDIKVTSIIQPQSSCPFRSARQKVYGLGYSLLLFVYEKTDNAENQTGNLKILHTVFIEAKRTADYQLTKQIRDIIENNKLNEPTVIKEDIISLFTDRSLPLDDIQANRLADEILSNNPAQGYLTISNALQWRLQYARVVREAGKVEGVLRIG